NIVEDPYLFFEKELLENINLLEDHQLNKLILDLERVPILRELCYTKFLESDIEYGKFNDF
ncbi:14381_t:CDS:2, partial [Racocetra persica]